MQQISSDRRSGWRLVAGLWALSFIPVVAGAVRLVSVAKGVVTPENARFLAEPVPVVVHVVGASLFCVLGALQFWPAFLRFSPRWHRIAGRALAPAGLAAALSGLWMNQFYPHPAGDGVLLYVFRLVFGLGMAASIVLGVGAVLRRNIAAHREWMLRAYAIGLGAGTQAATQLPWILAMGQPSELARALLMAAGWLINLAVAEWINRRNRTRGQATRAPRRRGLQPSAS